MSVRGKDRSSDEKEPVMAMYEPSLTEERTAMPVGCAPAAETAIASRFPVCELETKLTGNKRRNLRPAALNFMELRNRKQATHQT